MKKLLLFLILFLIITPVTAISNNFLINVTSLPEWYLVDYGPSNAATVIDYSISCPFNQSTEDTWYLYCSNDNAYFVTVDGRANESFVMDIFNNYIVTTPVPCRYYLLYLRYGFYNVSGYDINLTLNANLVTPQGFLATSQSTTNFDTNLFMNKWLLILIGVILVIVGFIIMPWISIIGLLFILYKFITDLTIYSDLEKMAIMVIIISSILLIIRRLSR